MSGQGGHDIEGPWDYGTFTITCTRTPRPDLRDHFWAMYEQAFGPLRVLAVARQVLTEEEFSAELDNPRVWKYLALDSDGELAGLTTLSDDLSTMPWISPEYFEHHYPREWSRRAVFYVGVTLVRPDKRRDHIFTMMAEHVAQRVASVEGVLGYDLCGFNDRSRSLGRVIEHIGAPHFETVQPIDVQTYYAAQTHGYRIKEEAGQNS